MSAAPVYSHECCYMCHGCGSVARDMYGPGVTVIESDVACPYCNGKGTVVVERPSQPTPAQLPQGRADEPAAKVQEERERDEAIKTIRAETRIADLERLLGAYVDCINDNHFAKAYVPAPIRFAARAALKGSK